MITKLSECLCVKSPGRQMAPRAGLQGGTPTLIQMRLRTTCVVQVQDEYSHEGQQVRWSCHTEINVTKQTSEESCALAQAAPSSQERVTHKEHPRMRRCKRPMIPQGSLPPSHLCLVASILHLEFSGQDLEFSGVHSKLI